MNANTGGVVIDGECVPNAPDGMIVARQSKDEPPPPDRTITDGQSTTITARLPTNLYQVIGGNCTRRGNRPEPDHTMSTGWCGDASKLSGTQYGECLGPYTVVLGEQYDNTGDHENADDDWVTTDGLRITVNTADSGLTDNTGTIEIGYFLRGHRTTTRYGTDGRVSVGQSEVECSLQVSGPMRVKVRSAARRGMTRTVSEYSPPDEWIGSTSTVEFTCEQAHLEAGVCLTLGDDVIRESVNEFLTPRGCVIVVLGTVKGYGSTGCVSRDEAQGILDSQGKVVYDENGVLVSGTFVDFDGLDRCKEGERPAVGERCVARN